MVDSKTVSIQIKVSKVTKDVAPNVGNGIIILHLTAEAEGEE